MPTYEYVCEKCGKKFERFQRMSAEPIKVCPDAECKGHVKRLIGEGAGIIFKGHGFYCTDYKSTTPPASEHHHPHHTEPVSTSAESKTTPTTSDSTSKSSVGSGSTDKAAAS